MFIVKDYEKLKSKFVSYIAIGFWNYVYFHHIRSLCKSVIKCDPTQQLCNEASMELIVFFQFLLTPSKKVITFFFIIDD